MTENFSGTDMEMCNHNDNQFCMPLHGNIFVCTFEPSLENFHEKNEINEVTISHLIATKRLICPEIGCHNEETQKCTVSATVTG